MEGKCSVGLMIRSEFFSDPMLLDHTFQKCFSGFSAPLRWNRMTIAADECWVFLFLQVS